VLLVAALAGTAFYTSSASPAARLSPLAVVSTVNTTGPLSYHSALYVNATAPTGSVFPGEQVTAQFRVQVPTYASAAGSGQIRIPNSLIQFPTTAGALRVYLSAVNFTIVNNGSQEILAGPSVRWTLGVTFNVTGPALMSTQGLAVMASWPYGEYPVQFSWRWVMTAVDGTPSSGFWSPWAQVTPPQIANLAGTPAKNWQLGLPYQLCLNGPVAGRTFQVHVSIANPVAQYTGASFVVPASFGAAYCWNNNVPANTTPQQAFIHIWEYANVTFQLYDYPIELTNNQSSSTSLVAFIVTGWVPVLIGAAVVIGVVVAVELTLLNARQRRGGG
jgi:hypothetical protein